MAYYSKDEIRGFCIGNGDYCSLQCAGLTGEVITENNIILKEDYDEDVYFCDFCKIQF